MRWVVRLPGRGAPAVSFGDSLRAEETAMVFEDLEMGLAIQDTVSQAGGWSGGLASLYTLLVGARGSREDRRVGRFPETSVDPVPPAAGVESSMGVGVRT